MTLNPRAIPLPKARKVWDRKIRNYREQVRALWRIVAKCTGDPQLVDFAAAVIRDNDIPENQPRQLARFLQKYVQQNIKFWREHPERWQSPLRTLKWGIGDCDDQVILLAATLRSFRIPVRLVFVRFIDPRLKQRKSHVYTQAKIGDEWVSLETVKPVSMGYDPAQRMREQGIRILGIDRIGDK